jgi:hypothetical protein
MRWSGHRARWQGTEFSCSPEPRPEGLWVRLRRPTAAPGFTEVAPGRHVRVVPAAECDVLLAAVTVCRWRGEPWVVHDERPGELLLEHTGGSTPRARELGAGRVDRGVHRRWVPRDEVTGLHEQLTVLSTPVG